MTVLGMLRASLGEARRTGSRSPLLLRTNFDVRTLCAYVAKGGLIFLWHVYADVSVRQHVPATRRSFPVGDCRRGPAPVWVGGVRGSAMRARLRARARPPSASQGKQGNDAERRKGPTRHPLPL